MFMLDSGRELKWLTNLGYSEFFKRKSEGATLRDLHKVNYFSTYDKTYSKWLKSIINEGIIYKSDQKRISGQMVDIYLIDHDKLVEKVRWNEAFNISAFWVVREDIFYTPNKYEKKEENS